MLLTIKEHGSKIARNSVFDCRCRLSPVGHKWQWKTISFNIFWGAQKNLIEAVLLRIYNIIMIFFLFKHAYLLNSFL